MHGERGHLGKQKKFQVQPQDIKVTEIQILKSPN
jgi:hypothetical protein